MLEFYVAVTIISLVGLSVVVSLLIGWMFTKREAEWTQRTTTRHRHPTFRRRHGRD